NGELTVCLKIGVVVVLLIGMTILAIAIANDFKPLNTSGNILSLEQEIKKMEDLTALEAAQMMATKASKYINEGDATFLLFRADCVRENVETDSPHAVILEAMQRIADQYRMKFSLAVTQKKIGQRCTDNEDFNSGRRLITHLALYVELEMRAHNATSQKSIDAVRTDFENLKNGKKILFQTLRDEDERKNIEPVEEPIKPANNHGTSQNLH
ncbi:MAG: hypothetical protein Q7S57_06000, partial [bacterium]|nr:hypothetical protein [bacterium]